MHPYIKSWVSVRPLVSLSRFTTHHITQQPDHGFPFCFLLMVRLGEAVIFHHQKLKKSEEKLKKSEEKWRSIDRSVDRSTSREHHHTSSEHAHKPPAHHPPICPSPPPQHIHHQHIKHLSVWQGPYGPRNQNTPTTDGKPVSCNNSCCIRAGGRVAVCLNTGI